MVDNFPLILTSQYQKQATLWLNAIKRGESACVLFTPKTDRFIRIGQLLNDRELMKQVLGEDSRYFFQQIVLDAHNVEERRDLENEIVENLNFSKISSHKMTFNEWINYLQKHKVILVLIIPEAEKFLNPVGSNVLTVLNDMVHRHIAFMRILSFFETDMTHPSLIHFLPTSGHLYSNIFRYQLYSEGSTHDFINLLEDYWSIKVDQKIKAEIIAGCGGHFWLVKEAVREIVKNGEWSPKNDDMTFRLRVLYDSFLPSEQSVLQKVVTNKKDFSAEEEHSLEHLKKMNIISDKDKCTLGLLNDFLLQMSDTSSKLKLKDNRVFFNDLPLNNFFSRKEYIAFKLLLEKRGTLVTRDDLAERIWPKDTQENYSDWAIDQIIARLRKRMVQLSLPPKLIKVVRGKGYKLKL